MPRSFARRVVALCLSLAVPLVLVGCKTAEQEPIGSPAAPPISAAASPTALIEQAVTYLAQWYIEPLDPGPLYGEAWDGAAAALRKAGAAPLPPTPMYPSDHVNALAVHRRTFPELIRVAEHSIGTQALVDAALDEIVKRRANCHTGYYPRRPRASAASDLVRAQERWLGVHLSESSLPRILHVFPESPAAQAGLRRGQQILSIEGRSTHAMGRIGTLASNKPS